MKKTSRFAKSKFEKRDFAPKLAEIAIFFICFDKSRSHPEGESISYAACTQSGSNGRRCAHNPT